MLNWYPSAICFKDPDNVFIDRNWFMSEYSNPTISMSYCRNTTDNNNWCKSKSEIDAFLKTRASFFININTFVQESIFSGDSRLDRFPHNGMN